MLSIALLVLSAIQVGCVIWLCADTGDRSRRRPSVILILVGLGLAYDSAIFGLGATLGEGALLETLNIGRFTGHVLLTPLLAIWAARQVFGPRPRWPWAVAGALIVWGIAADLVNLDLEPRSFGDTLRYTPAIPHGPPIPALLVSAAVLATGIWLWRKNSWPWLALGAIALIATAGVAFTVPPLGNAGEAVLFAAIVTTERLSTHSVR